MPVCEARRPIWVSKNTAKRIVGVLLSLDKGGGPDPSSGAPASSHLEVAGQMEACMWLMCAWTYDRVGVTMWALAQV